MKAQNTKMTDTDPHTMLINSVLCSKNKPKGPKENLHVLRMSVDKSFLSKA
uniref:Uncharacterized protein n=1 Tax=Arundo donax TaxID=35708 RepID=A0A0A9FN05_ARUDO